MIVIIPNLWLASEPMCIVSHIASQGILELPRVRATELLPTSHSTDPYLTIRAKIKNHVMDTLLTPKASPRYTSTGSNRLSANSQLQPSIIFPETSWFS